MYKKLNILDEMAYNLYDYESKVITVNMMNFVKHLIKLKLCDSSFSDKIHKDIYPFVKEYKKDWLIQSEQILSTLFDKLRTKKLNRKAKRDTKENAYLSVLNNIDIELQKGDAVDAIRNAIDDLPDYKTIVRKAEKHLIICPIDKEVWFNQIIFFLLKIKPSVMLIPSEDFVKKEFDKFIIQFTRGYEGR